MLPQSSSTVEEKKKSDLKVLKDYFGSTGQ